MNMFINAREIMMNKIATATVLKESASRILKRIKCFSNPNASYKENLFQSMLIP